MHGTAPRVCGCLTTCRQSIRTIITSCEKYEYVSKMHVRRHIINVFSLRVHQRVKKLFYNFNTFRGNLLLSSRHRFPKKNSPKVSIVVLRKIQETAFMNLWVRNCRFGINTTQIFNFYDRQN